MPEGQENTMVTGLSQAEAPLRDPVNNSKKQGNEADLLRIGGSDQPVEVQGAVKGVAKEFGLDLSGDMSPAINPDTLKPDLSVQDKDQIYSVREEILDESVDDNTSPTEQGGDASKVEIYKDPNYVSLYRYENPSNNQYDERREGSVSRREIVGNWFTDSINDLKTYTRTRIRGQRGGRFVVVRVKKDDLDRYDATKIPETREMDIERGNYIVPDEVGSTSRVEVDGVFKDSWEGRKNIPFADWHEIDGYIDRNLSDGAIIANLEQLTSSSTFPTKITP